ncbi:LysR family transcriptional regulator [Roseivivax isoporae]|uniref:LysR family transcriptional regulator n=1 Tax=Roseivivax isoporae LMG 25204 TaxID=1449351 RepID=X7F3X2_9RHOB|nr:LysR family transcriptional regulator [Roseivivax isoporae]ETX27490.1 LysR family transcriptional regulator [Roseivivax isoporae LMG 25204]
MDRLNYHHLRYFREVAREGNLTRAAGRLNLSQSALSTQIRQLEERLGHPLFDRVGRRLELTEAGRIALDHADRIFDLGEDLVSVLGQRREVRTPLKVGALSTLSRNFQLRFLRPALASPHVDLVLTSGSSAVLLQALDALALDIVLLTEPPPRAAFPELVAHRIAEQPVGLFGTPARVAGGDLLSLLSTGPMILPSESSIRTGFDSLTARLGVTPRIAAVVDDMAMVRLLTREDMGLALAPSVVFADEIASGMVGRAPVEIDIVESFYAVTARRSFPHPLVETLIAQDVVVGA